MIDNSSILFSNYLIVLVVLLRNSHKSYSNGYYDVEGKDKDENEDEESRVNFNKKASTYVCTQASLPIGKPVQQRSCLE